MTLPLIDLGLYAGALLILFLTPGPVWVALIARSLAGGFQAAWPLAIGVVLGDILWPLAALYGLAWVVSAHADVMVLLRWFAVGIFLWMGVSLIRHAGRGIAVDRRLTRPGRLPGFLAGVAVIVGNPKAILFYLGILPGFFSLTTLSVVDTAAIVGVSALIPLLGNLLFALLIDRARALLQTPTALARLNRIAGGLLIAVGVVIAL